ncbi:MAG TPA: hypothetical protein VGC67_04845 [Cellulomonas sp.]
MRPARSIRVGGGSRNRSGLALARYNARVAVSVDPRAGAALHALLGSAPGLAALAAGLGGGSGAVPGGDPSGGAATGHGTCATILRVAGAVPVSRSVGLSVAEIEDFLHDRAGAHRELAAAVAAALVTASGPQVGVLTLGPFPLPPVLRGLVVLVCPDLADCTGLAEVVEALADERTAPAVASFRELPGRGRAVGP